MSNRSMCVELGIFYVEHTHFSYSAVINLQEHANRDKCNSDDLRDVA